MVFETDSPRLPLSGATVFPLHIGGALPSCLYFETVSLAKSHFASLSEAKDPVAQAFQPVQHLRQSLERLCYQE